jgi:hypothetical protein
MDERLWFVLGSDQQPQSDIGDETAATANSQDHECDTYQPNRHIQAASYTGCHTGDHSSLDGSFEGRTACWF